MDFIKAVKIVEKSEKSTIKQKMKNIEKLYLQKRKNNIKQTRKKLGPNKKNIMTKIENIFLLQRHGQSKADPYQVPSLKNSIGMNGYNSGNCSECMYVDVIETFAAVLYDYSLFRDTNFVDWVCKLPEFSLSR